MSDMKVPHSFSSHLESLKKFNEKLDGLEPKKGALGGRVFVNKTAAEKPIPFNNLIREYNELVGTHQNDESLAIRKEIVDKLQVLDQQSNQEEIVSTLEEEVTGDSSTKEAKSYRELWKQQNGQRELT